MACSREDQHSRIIVDSVHGDIHLTRRECRVIDTASFQRLRDIKQLGMAHHVYPNATHTRFAHSLGVMAIMIKLLDPKRCRIELDEEQQADLRLAALLHDIGHYPYSHLMETVHKVRLTEELIDTRDKSIGAAGGVRYPDHDALGRLIVSSQQDLIDAIGGEERARRIADFIGRTSAADKQLSKLISSSLDMDRLDYLLRDSNATGTPYGQVDVNYLLNNVRISPNGLLGVAEKALPAAEQYLLARYFMHRAVYFHKTTFALEEVCRHLLRRLRDVNAQGLPRNAGEVEKIIKSNELRSFTDAFLDKIVQGAVESSDAVIAALAQAICSRRPPKLLKEVPVLRDREGEATAGTVFEMNCRHRLTEIARRFDVPAGRFLFSKTKPLSLEHRAHHLTVEDARQLEPEEEDPLIKVFVAGKDEPISIVDVPHSVIGRYSAFSLQIYRLYFVRANGDKQQMITELCQAVAEWDKSEST